MFVGLADVRSLAHPLAGAGACLRIEPCGYIGLDVANESADLPVDRAFAPLQAPDFERTRTNADQFGGLSIGEQIDFRADRHGEVSET